MFLDHNALNLNFIYFHVVIIILLFIIFKTFLRFSKMDIYKCPFLKTQSLSQHFIFPIIYIKKELKEH